MIGSPSRGNWIMLKMLHIGRFGLDHAYSHTHLNCPAGFWRRLREHARRGDMWSDVNQPTLPHRQAPSQSERAGSGLPWPASSRP